MIAISFAPTLTSVRRSERPLQDVPRARAPRPGRDFPVVALDELAQADRRKLRQPAGGHAPSAASTASR